MKDILAQKKLVREASGAPMGSGIPPPTTNALKEPRSRMSQPKSVSFSPQKHLLPGGPQQNKSLKVLELLENLQESLL